MHTNKTFRWAVILLLLASIGLSGCASQKKPIRIAISAWAGVEPAELAAQLGYYEKYGVDVELVRFSAYSDSLEALRDENVDGLTSSTGSCTRRSLRHSLWKATSTVSQLPIPPNTPSAS